MKKENKPGDKLKAIINGMVVKPSNLKEIYPEFNEIKSRIVRLTVWNLDGSTSEMKFVYPAFCFNGDCQDRAGAHIEEWCREMTRFFLPILSYQIDFGIVLQDGTEKIGGCCFFKKNVPVDKIYVVTQHQEGKWMTEAEAKKHDYEKYANWERPLRYIDEETMTEDEISFVKSYNEAVKSGVMDQWQHGNPGEN